MIQTSNDKNYDPDFSKLSEMADSARNTHNIFANKQFQEKIVKDNL